jgi:hypothetical protein
MSRKKGPSPDNRVKKKEPVVVPTVMNRVGVLNVFEIYDTKE